MIDFSQAKLTELCISQVGNKLKKEGYEVGKYPVDLGENLEYFMTEYLISPFKSDAFFKFDTEENGVYWDAMNLFRGAIDLPEFICNATDNLYNHSIHPHIKPGTLFVGRLSNVEVEGLMLEALVIVKAETKSSMIIPSIDQAEPKIQAHTGMQVGKVDHGVLILNTMEEDGYSVLVFSKNALSYWKDDFLKLDRIPDPNYLTSSFMEMVRDYADEVLYPNRSLIEKKELLVRAMSYMKKKKELDFDEFMSVCIKPVDRKGFREYAEEYLMDKEVPMDIDEGFEISRKALTPFNKSFAPSVTVDTGITMKINSKDFHVANSHLERGFDKDRNMYYYKTFFNADE